MAKPGYHLREIKRGVLGEISKIREELEELEDAEQQGVRLMALVELSDMIGAIRAYLAKNHPSTTLDDLVLMNDVTKRAFENGHRKSRHSDVPFPPHKEHQWTVDQDETYCIACYDAFNKYMGSKDGLCPGRKVKS